MTKQSLARLGFPLSRIIVRTMPSPVAEWWHDNVFTPQFLWRGYSTVGTTRDGVKLHLRCPDLIQTYLYLFGVWEPAITAWLRGRLGPGDVFVDVGANIGYYTLLASRLVGTSGHAYAVEAAPTIAEHLRRNVLLNAASNVSVLNAAAADRPGTLPIFMAHAYNTGHSTTTAAVADGMTRAGEVKAAPLHQLINPEHVFAARVIKIDVEGGEASVIDGIRDVLPRFAQHTEWLIEVNPNALEAQSRSAEDLLRVFRNAGYRLYTLPNAYSVRGYTRKPGGLQPLTGVPAEQVDVVATKHG